MSNRLPQGENPPTNERSDGASSVSLDERLKLVARLPSDMTKEERDEHKISLAMGMLPLHSTTTREDLKEVLESGRF